MLNVFPRPVSAFPLSQFPLFYPRPSVPSAVKFSPSVPFFPLSFLAADWRPPPYKMVPKIITGQRRFCSPKIRANPVHSFQPFPHSAAQSFPCLKTVRRWPSVSLRDPPRPPRLCVYPTPVCRPKIRAPSRNSRQNLVAAGFATSLPSLASVPKFDPAICGSPFPCYIRGHP